MNSGILRIMVANVINLCIGLVNSFFLPRYLSVETYAMIKTYTLYLSYAGFFTLGYQDGMYLKYGGRTLSQVAPDEYGTDFNNMFLLQGGLGIIIAIIACATGNGILLAFSFGMWLNNMSGCYQTLFQSVGEFGLYSKALNIKPFIALISSLFLLFILQSDNYVPYIVCQILASVVPFIYITCILQSNLHFLGTGGVRLQNFWDNISSGFVLMLGNFSGIILTGIDRWFIKLLMTTTDFAIYSFAVSVDSLVAIFVNPVTITMYHTLCIIKESDKIREMKRMILLWGCCIVALAFPAKWVIEHFLDKYLHSVELIFLLFATQAFYSVIKGVYVNLFKARKQQKIYFRQMLLIVIIAAVLNGVGFLIFRSRVSIAAATFLSAFIWMCINEKRNPEIAFTGKEWIFIGLILALYFACGFWLGSVSGLLVYVIGAVLLSLFLMRETAFNMVSAGKTFVTDKWNQIMKKRTIHRINKQK